MTMRTYVTTKLVNARPEDKDGEAGYRVEYPDDHVSWCPKDTFERTSRIVDTAEFALFERTVKPPPDDIL